MDIILCEDTRRAQKLKNHFTLEPRLVSLHEHNERMRIPKILDAMKAGKSFALISDAGTPLLSDPGFLLVSAMIGAELPFTCVPGPSAIVNALVLSGFPLQRFSFFGFLPHTASTRRAGLQEMVSLHNHTLVLFESPERILGLLREVGEVLGDRQVAVCREMTKLHEEIVRGRISDLIPQLSQRKLQGEFTLVIAPGEEQKLQMTDDWIVARFQQMLQEGLSRKEALKKLAKESGRSRNDLYDLLVKDQERPETE